MAKMPFSITKSDSQIYGNIFSTQNILKCITPYRSCIGMYWVILVMFSQYIKIDYSVNIHLTVTFGDVVVYERGDRDKSFRI
jgi:hypothetical protein